VQVAFAVIEREFEFSQAHESVAVVRIGERAILASRFAVPVGRALRCGKRWP